MAYTVSNIPNKWIIGIGEAGINNYYKQDCQKKKKKIIINSSLLYLFNDPRIIIDQVDI